MREIKFRAWNKVEKTMGDSFSLETAIRIRPMFSDPTENAVYMQYTGLKDKNGKEIYEGDLFLCHYAKDGCKEQPMEVVYNKDRFTFKRRGICQQLQVIQAVHDHEGWRGEIIGNIYENPELTKN